MFLKRKIDYEYNWDFIDVSTSQIKIQVSFTTPANISSSSEPDRLRIKFEHTAEFFRKAQTIFGQDRLLEEIDTEMTIVALPNGF